MSVLDVRLVKRLPGFTLDTGWTARDGITVLFGYSGTGKSLTLSAIAGLDRPDEGWVRLGGETLCETATAMWTPPERRRFGYVSQVAELFPHMDVRRNVEYGVAGTSRTERRERAAEAMATLGVEALVSQRPDELSGGQRQRVALARALAGHPRLLLLDEPFSALDAPVRREMRALVRRVRERRGIPIVMVTHDLAEAHELADTLVVYSRGGVVQFGHPAEVVADPGTPEIRRLLTPGGVVPIRRVQ